MWKIGDIVSVTVSWWTAQRGKIEEINDTHILLGPTNEEIIDRDRNPLVTKIAIPFKDAIITFLDTTALPKPEDKQNESKSKEN